MAVRCTVGEPDGIALAPGTTATVYLDAYPDITLPAHIEFVSPVASSALGSPVKTFTGLVKLDRSDARVMPDLSAAMDPTAQAAFSTTRSTGLPSSAEL